MKNDEMRTITEAMTSKILTSYSKDILAYIEKHKIEGSFEPGQFQDITIAIFSSVLANIFDLYRNEINLTDSLQKTFDSMKFLLLNRN